MDNTSFPLRIIDYVWRLQHELELIGENNVVLNDIASIIYGLPRIISEIRIVVEGRDLDGIVNVLSYVLSVHSYSDQLLELLRKKGSVAINPVTIPIVYIIVADRDIEHRCLDDKLDVEVRGYRLYVPRLEDYISYLLSLKAQYPYIVDALTLAIIHSSIIEPERLADNGVSMDRLCDLLAEIEMLTKTFYELKNVVGEAIRILCSSG